MLHFTSQAVNTIYTLVIYLVRFWSDRIYEGYEWESVHLCHGIWNSVGLNACERNSVIACERTEWKARIWPKLLFL